MSIVLERLVKHYETHTVVNDVSLEVAEGEFFVLLGPSGSGKSTALRMIAGLAEVDSGTIRLHGRDVTRLRPQHRGVGLVFQHYALFRHMSVAKNVEFALRIRRVPSAKRRQRRDELLSLVGLAGLGGRMPSQLSGGQQQRVALARALAHQPEVLLLDEPFGALDARIRTDLRRTVRRIQRELGITTIFVTHDQEEAFELADRIGVMNFGRLLEVGPPHELYLHPQTEFVATFLGTANLMVGESAADGVRLGPVHFPLGTEHAANPGTSRVQVLFRPEDVAVKDSPEALDHPLLGRAVVAESSFSGSFERLSLRLPKIAGVRPISPPAPYGDDFFLVEASRSQHQARRFPLRPGDQAWVGVRRVHALTHPGLSFLLVMDGTPASRAAVEMGGKIAQLAHARVTILACGASDGGAVAQLKAARATIGAGLTTLEARSSPDPPSEALALECDGRHYDLVVHELPRRGRVDAAERLLQAGDHSLLLIAKPRAVPSRALICVAIGEPGKEDVMFAGRLVRHLGAEATLFTSLPEDGDAGMRVQAERFLDAGTRTLSLLGVPARKAIGVGEARDAILAQLATGAHDLLVVGAPLAKRRGRLSLEGIVGSIVTEVTDLPVLIVRSHLEPRWGG